MTTKTGDRDLKTGRFLKGHPRKAGPGRPPNSPKTLTQTLKDKLDADAIAELLIKRAKESDQVLIYVVNRIDGMPKQAIEMEHKDDSPAVKAIREWQAELKASRNGHGST